MASVMGIGGGLVGPKTENVDFSLVLIVFFEVASNPGEFRSGQHGLDLGGLGVAKVTFFIKIMLWLYLKICFPLEREAYFQKNHENKWSENDKWSRKTLDGKCDGYLWGLSGAEKRNC